MAEVTYFVALPFVRTDDGAAVRRAAALALVHAGAVAFTRSGDPATGVFADAVVLASHGSVPSVDELLAAD
jgi:hypothetical protein